MPSEFKLRWGWPFPDMKDGPPLGFMARSAIIMPIVGTASKIWLNWMNKATVHNGETFSWWVNNRPADQALITVSNHYSCMDDPLLYGVLPWRTLWSSTRMRWSLAAHDVVFTQRILSWFFSTGKCVPVIRGIGVNQRAMDFCTSRLREGAWVHIFPEGKVNDTKEQLRLKWGVGRLVYDCWASKDTSPGDNLPAAATAGSSVAAGRQQSPLTVIKECGTEIGAILRRRSVAERDDLGSGYLEGGGAATKTGVIAAASTCDARLTAGQTGSQPPASERPLDARGELAVEGITGEDLHRFPGKVPVVLPIYHIGMDTVLPNKYPYIPRIRKKVTILIGDPIPLDEIMAKISHNRYSPEDARRIITDHIQDSLWKLRLKAEELHSQQQ